MVFSLSSSSLLAGKFPGHCGAAAQGARKNVSPRLDWSDSPEGTKTFALLLEDLDDDNTTHWLLYNVPAWMTLIQERNSGTGRVAAEIEGFNDCKFQGWVGPLPHQRGHHFRFTLFALDCQLPLKNKVTKDKLIPAMEGHILAMAVLTAQY